MVRILQGLSSSNATITRRIIMYRITEIDSINIEYLSLPHVVTVLDSLEHQKSRE